MNYVDFGAGAFGFGVILVVGLLQVAWYVGVIVMLVLIWRKVRHLPS